VGSKSPGEDGVASVGAWGRDVD